MFERYTETARRVIFFARFFASRLGSSCIEPEHILRALLKEEPDVFRAWLKSESDYDAFRAEVEGPPPGQERVPDSADMPMSYPAMRVLTYAAEEAERQNHGDIRPTHLLAGLLREPGTRAEKTLRKFGIEIQQLRMVFVTSVKPPSSKRPETDDLHRLIDELPVSQLGRARAVLQALKRDQHPADPA